jgi:lysophospholipase L1-like esterase
VTGRYVALGSSMAAGPGIRPSAAGAPFGSGRSARNYAHLVAERLNLDLVDVTFSGATTAHLLADRQRSARPQIEALDGSEELVTITIGGNDVGYVPLLMAGSLPAVVRRLPPIAARLRELFDRGAREKALDGIEATLHAVGAAVRQRSPRARVTFVDYLTLLPPDGEAAAPLSAEHADLGRLVATRLEEATAAAAQATGCELLRAGHASRSHHGWSADPWAVAAGLPLPWRPAPFHPNAEGMRAVADLILRQTHGA